MLFYGRHADLRAQVPGPGHLSTVPQNKAVNVGQASCDILTVNIEKNFKFYTQRVAFLAI